MKKYDIITLEKQNAVLVMILDCESPFCYLKEICKELEHSNYMGTVIFDELLHSGNNEERFIKCRFAQGEFIADSFQFYDVPKQDVLRKYMDDYLRKDREGLRLSGLNSHQIGLLEKGCII